MDHPVSPALMAQLSDFVNARMGLHFPEKRWPDLARGMARAAEDFGFNEIEACIRWLTATPLTWSQIETLADHLTIGETYFFREPKALDALQNQIIPALLNHPERPGRIKIWSAGCCTGEEPYSMAMMLDRHFPALTPEKLTILATDINPRFLQKAKAGRYRDWSFRDMPKWAKEHYFTRLDSGEYQLSERIRNRVTFAPLNLMEDSYPSILNDTVNLDVIFCRNVLIYFDQKGIESVVGRFFRALTPGGWLAVSSTETSTVHYPQFSPVRVSGLMLYHKETPAAPKFVGAISKEAPPAAPKISPPPQLPAVPPAAPPPPPPIEPAVAYEALYRQALTLFQQSRYAETIALIQKTLVTAKPHDKNPPPWQTELFFLLIKAYANQGRLPEARHWGEKAIAVDKLNPEHYYLLGNILQEQGEYEQAAQALKRVLFLEPNFTLAMVALGNLARQQGKTQEAARHFRNSLLALKKLAPETILFGGDNVTAGELADIIQAMLK
jgi:chemotaxis protein methyltransferase CheR